MTYPADEGIQAFKPCTKLLISTGIVIKGTDRIEDEVHAFPIGQALKKLSKL